MVRDLQLAIRRFRFKPGEHGAPDNHSRRRHWRRHRGLQRRRSDNPPAAAVRAADRLVEVLDLYRSAGARSTSLTPQKIAGWQAQPSLFEGFEGYASREFDLTADELEPERVRGLIVSNGLFGMLGVQPHSAGDSRQRTAERESSASRSSVKGCGGAGLAGDRTYLGRASRSATNSTRSSGSCRGGSGSRVRAKICGCRLTSRHSGAAPAAGFVGIGRLAAGVDAKSQQPIADTLAARMQAQTPLPAEPYWDIHLLPNEGRARRGRRPRPRSSCCSPPWVSCSSSRARTPRTCFCRRLASVNTRWPFARRSARPVRGCFARY